MESDTGMNVVPKIAILIVLGKQKTAFKNIQWLTRYALAHSVALYYLTLTCVTLSFYRNKRVYYYFNNGRRYIYKLSTRCC